MEPYTFAVVQCVFALILSANISTEIDLMMFIFILCLTKYGLILCIEICNLLCVPHTA